MFKKGQQMYVLRLKTLVKLLIDQNHNYLHQLMALNQLFVPFKAKI